MAARRLWFIMHRAAKAPCRRRPVSSTLGVMLAPFTITYQLVGTGWSVCRLNAGALETEISASYLSDALGNLILSALAVASGFRSVSFGFDQEPGEYRWIIETVDTDLVRLRIVEFGELWGNKPDDAGRLHFEVSMRPRQYAEAVASAAEDVLVAHGLNGYAERWADHKFPERELTLLRSAIESRYQ